MTEFTQAVNQGFLYVTGLGMKWFNANTIQINPGVCRDSTNSIDIPLNTTIYLNTNAIGAGGLDKGSMQANKSYNVYLLFDPTLKFPTSVICGLTKDENNNLTTGPQVPFNYAIFRRIGYFTTVNSTNINNFQQNGNGSEKFYNLDFPGFITVNANAPNYNIIAFQPYMPDVPGMTAIINVALPTPGSTVGIRTLGSTNNNNTQNYITLNSSSGSYPGQFNIITAASGLNNPAIEYSTNNACNVRIIGYIDSL